MKEKSFFARVFPFACVWFGFHVGPTFCSGALNMNYYIGAGAKGLFLPLVTYGIGGFFIWLGLTIAYNNNAHDYRTFFNVLYPKQLGFMRPLWNANQIISNTVGCSTMLAFGASSLNTWFGLPEFWGTIVVGVACVLLVFKGQGLLSKFSTALTVSMIACVSIASIVMISKNYPAIAQRVATGWEPEGVSFGPFVRGSISYGGAAFQSVVPMVAFLGSLKSQKDVRNSTVLGMCFAIVMLTLMSLMMLPFVEELTGVSLPGVELIKRQMPWMYPIYSVVLFIAMLTSAPVFFVAEVQNYSRSKFLFPENGKIQDDTTKRLIVGAVMFVLTVAVANLGFSWFVNVWFKVAGILGFSIVGLPLIYGGICLIRDKKAKT